MEELKLTTRQDLVQTIDAVSVGAAHALQFTVRTLLRTRRAETD
jgi:hypothetical protein